jgi:hypothetical protein
MKMAPGDIIRLGVIYQENGTAKKSQTNLTCHAVNQNGTIILPSQSLTENQNIDGEYFYLWNTASIGESVFAVVIYLKGISIISTDTYFFETSEDMDGVAM